MNKALHTIHISTVGTDRVMTYHWTNDDEDRGYPTTESRWSVPYKSVVEALESTGGSRVGVGGCRVIVYLEGEGITHQQAKQLVKQAKKEGGNDNATK